MPSAINTRDALAHLRNACKALSLEAWSGTDPRKMERIEHFTIAEELRRVDAAIGPKATSIFATMAHDIEQAYVEILAARQVLGDDL